MGTYLITGGAGFIGSNYIHYLFSKYKNDSFRVINYDKLTYAGNLENLKSVEEDSRYVFVQGDICNQNELDEIWRTYDIDYIINFAAESHVDRSIFKPDEFIKTNVMGTVSLLDSARKNWGNTDGTFKAGAKYIQISTDEVYGSLGPQGVFTETTGMDPHSPYSASKAAADHFVKSYYDTYGLPTNITRCSNNYGPYQFPEKLIPLIINNALKRAELPVYGTGENIRDWIYVEDHCKAIDCVLLYGRRGEVYNIGGASERTNIEVVTSIVDYLSSNFDKDINENLIKYVADRKGHDYRYAIDFSKIQNELGWSPNVKYEEGMERTILWYLSHREWLSRITDGEYRTYYKKMYGRN